jgi:hypothetical protein
MDDEKEAALKAAEASLTLCRVKLSEAQENLGKRTEQLKTRRRARRQAYIERRRNRTTATRSCYKVALAGQRAALRYYRKAKRLVPTIVEAEKAAMTVLQSAAEALDKARAELA